jgi:transposase
MKYRVNYYTDEFKIKVVQEYMNTNQTMDQLLMKYDIRGASKITEWMRTFGFKEPRGNVVSNRLPMNRVKSSNEKELEAKIQELQRKLEYEQLRALALNTLIDVAERDLKISIRKKPGAKQ